MMKQMTFLFPVAAVFCLILSTLTEYSGSAESQQNIFTLDNTNTTLGRELNNRNVARSTAQNAVVFNRAIFVLAASVLFMNSVQSESLHQSNQIADLNRKLDRILETIEVLNQTISSGSENTQQKIFTLEINITTLRRELDDRNAKTAIAIWDERVQNMTGQVNKFSERILPSECMRDIKDGRFLEAVKKFEILRGNETLAADVIIKVYNGQVKNIPLINDFGKSLRSVADALIVYRSLANELKSTGDQPVEEIREISRLLEAIESRVVNQPQVDKSKRAEARAVAQRCRNVVKRIAANELEKSMNDDTFSTTSNVTVKEIILILYKTDADLFYDTLTDVCNRVYGNLGASRIIGYIDSINFVGPTLDGYVALFYTVRHEHGIHSQEMVQLAFDFRKVTQLPLTYFKWIEVKNRLKKLENLWPKSLAAIASGSSVCIKNVRYNEYLYAPPMYGTHYVFTWQPGHKMWNVKWEMNRQPDGSLAIKNVELDEYLFSSNLPQHSMYTWKPQRGVIPDSWRLNVHPTEDSVTIENIHNQVVVLMAAGDPHNDVQRIVYGHEGHNDSVDAQWMLEECAFPSNEKVSEDLQMLRYRFFQIERARNEFQCSVHNSSTT